MNNTSFAPLALLRHAADLYGDVVTAYVDVSRRDEDGAHEVEVRVENLRRVLGEAGADGVTVDAVSARLLEPTGHGGEISRVVVAHDGQTVVDVLLAAAVPSRQHHSSVAHLLGLAQATAVDVRHAVVLVDHVGADITIAGTSGPDEKAMDAEGDHDVLHKVRGGGWAHRRFQTRVEDSIDRNADTVARELDRVVARERIDVVLVAGDPRSCARVRESVGAEVARRMEVLDHGSRAEDGSDDRLEDDVAGALERCRTGRLDRVLDRLGAGPAAKGVAETVEALRRGEVDTLVLLEDAIGDRHAYVAPEPLLISTDPEELLGLGVDEQASVPLGEAMIRAAIGQDAGLQPLYAPVGVLPDGVGAVLRFDSRPDPTNA
jgi:hypothetical protein